MSFNGLPAERFSDQDLLEQRDSHVRAIDLSDPNRDHDSPEIHAETQTEKDRSIQMLAKLAESRIKIIELRFENGTREQNTRLATELIEEARMWQEDIAREKEFVINYREETGESEAFSGSLMELLRSEKAVSSELEHMLDVVRLWHEDDPEIEGIGEGIIEDNADAGLIQEKAPESETMIVASDVEAQAESSPTEAGYLPNGYHEVAANDTEEQQEEALEAVTPEEEKLIASPIIPIEQKDTDAFLAKETAALPKVETSELIVIPNGLEATQEKCYEISKTIRSVDAIIDRGAGYMDRETLDGYLISLSKDYAALHERLDFLNLSPQGLKESTEEKEVIASAIHQIEDARLRIHKLDLEAKTPDEKLERLLDCKRLKREKLLSIEERLIAAIGRNGISNPELYMVEQASGLGSIRRGIMNLFGKKESIITKAILTKLRNEAIQAEEQYLQEAYTRNERSIGTYTRTEPGHILNIKDSDDVHAIWNAITAELEDLNSALDIPQHDKGQAEGKIQHAIHKGAEDTIIRSQARDDRELARRANKESEPSKLRHEDSLIAAIKKDPNWEDLTFLPEDYTQALAELRMATETKNLARLKDTLDRTRSMKEEISSLWIDMTDEEGNLITEDEAYMNKAAKILEDANKKSRPRSKKK